jgi:hypothetical protein
MRAYSTASTYSADTGAIVGLGGDIVTMAGDVDKAAAAVSGTPCLAGPPDTSTALADFAKAYGQTTDRLRDDVIALGRLTQAAGAEYDAVETAASQLHRAELDAAGDTAGSPPFRLFDPLRHAGPTGGTDG